MITLQIIKYDNANALEATWMDENGVILKCHSYADVQIDMLRADALAFNTPLTDFEALIAQIEAAIIPSMPDPIVIPQVVTMRQARRALLDAGLLTTIDTAIANGTDEALKIDWEYATEVNRNWQSLITLTQQLNISSTELDNLFLSASNK